MDSSAMVAVNLHLVLEVIICANIRIDLQYRIFIRRELMTFRLHHMKQLLNWDHRNVVTNYLFAMFNVF